MADESDIPDEQKNSIGILNAVVLIINAEAGAGILNFPESFKRTGGVVWAVILQLCFLCFTTSSLVALNVVSAKYNTETIGQLGLAVGGKRLGIVISFLIALEGTCNMMAYMVVIADNWDLALYTLDRERFCDKVWYYHRVFTVVVSSLVIILPNSFPRRVDYLRYASRVGVFGIFYVSLLITFYWMFYETKQGHIRTVPESFLELISVLPTFCYAHDCNVQSVPIFHSLRNKTWKKILLVAVLGNCFCFLLFFSVGTSGYLSFGDDVFENIIQNYSGGNPPVVIAMIFIVIKICCTYPIVLFVARKEYIRIYSYLRNQDPENNEFAKRIITVSIVFSITVLMGLFVKTIGIAISFSGTLTAFNLFFFPGIILFLSLRADKEQDNYKKKFLLAIALMTYGLIQFFLSFGLSAWRIILFQDTPPRHLCDEIE